MHPLRTLWLVVLGTVCLSSCNKAETRADIQSSASPSVDIRLKGTPVVKILSRENKHWLMTETIDVLKREEQERVIKLVTGKDLSNVNHAVSKDEYLADMALGPEADQLWVIVAPVKNRDVFVLRLLNEHEILREIEIVRPDKKHDDKGSWATSKDLKDVVRIVSEGNQVFIAGRNEFGFPFFATVQDRKIVQEPSIIGPAFEGSRLTARMSGVYSVMDQVVSPSKIHLVKCLDKIFVSWLAHCSEVHNSQEYYGISEEAIWKSRDYVAVVDVSRTLQPEVYKVGYALLQGIACEGDDLVLSGSSRIKEKSASAPFVIRHGTIRFFKDEFQKSASAQAVLIVDGQLIMGGSTEWERNPVGLSISDGLGFLKMGDRIETFGEIRTEVRSISHSLGVLCYAGMIAGPTTHSHDHDPASIRADGFFKCKNLDLGHSGK